MSAGAPVLADFFARTVATELAVAQTWFGRLRSTSNVYPSDPLVSVIVPTLAKDEHASRLGDLERLLRLWLRRQSYPHREVLVVSDGFNRRVADLVRVMGPGHRYLHTPRTTRAFGHPETRLGLAEARGDLFVRMNDDNRPYRDYLSHLASGFGPKISLTYGCVVFRGEARRTWRTHFRGMPTYIIPNDRIGTIGPDTIDCMCWMVRTEVARRFVNDWDDAVDGDWHFIEAVRRDGSAMVFVDRLVGAKR